MKDEGEAIFAEDENSKPTHQIAWTTYATPMHVAELMSAKIDGEMPGDGRSAPVWMRLHDGTLLLAIFPHGDTYMSLSDAGVCDWQDAEAE